ncbi:MAG: hypothetical protein ABSH41_28165 [Syntrophobacteraceae bacterium]
MSAEISISFLGIGESFGMKVNLLDLAQVRAMVNATIVCPYESDYDIGNEVLQILENSV